MKNKGLTPGKNSAKTAPVDCKTEGPAAPRSPEFLFLEFENKRREADRALQKMRGCLSQNSSTEGEEENLTSIKHRAEG